MNLSSPAVAAKMPSIAEFYTSAGGDTIPHVDFNFAFDLGGKYPPEMPVWLAMSPRGSCVQLLAEHRQCNGRTLL